MKREQFDYLDAKEDLLVDKLEDFLDIATINEERKVYLQYLSDLEELYDNDLSLSEHMQAIMQSRIDATKVTLRGLDSKAEAMMTQLRLYLDNTTLDLSNISLNYAKVAQIISDITQHLKTYNRDLLRYDIDKKLKLIDLAYYENQILPDLDLTLTVEREDEGGNTITTKYDNKARKYSSSLVFSVPLGGDIQDEENIAVAKLNLQKIALDYDAKRDDLVAEVSALIASLKADRKVLDTYPELLDKLQQIITTQYHNTDISGVLESLLQKRDNLLEYVEVMSAYQHNILKYEDTLDRIIR